jgi:hypothetical protein
LCAPPYDKPYPLNDGLLIVAGLQGLEVLLLQALGFSGTGNFRSPRSASSVKNSWLNFITTIPLEINFRGEVMTEDKSGDLTERKYHLKCKVKFFLKTIKEDVGRGVIKTYERKLVFLVPEESDQRTRFLMAWLPDTMGAAHELASFVSYPVDSPCRLACMRADDRSDRHYLMVMTKGVEDVMVRLREGSIINVETMAASDDSEADHAIQEVGTYEVFK